MQDKKRYDFKESENKWKEFWKREGIYSFDSKSKKKIFSIDTPPPYVSSFHLHVGHAIHYSQFEFIARYKKMKGFNVFFPMGFDDNGLPTERYVEKKYKIDKKRTNRKEFTKLCLKETELGRKNYEELWNSLGFSIDWNLTYSTIDKRSTKTAQESFLDLYKKGYLERKDVPIIWDTKLQTSLAQADLEDLEKDSFFNDVIFKSGKDDLIISTTRPELIPACVALFYNPKDKRYKKYNGKKAKVPLFNYEIPILEDSSVELDKGTGLMMVCTFGDKYDIEKWMKHNLDLRIILEEDGKLNKLAGKYKGKKVTEARKDIIEDLKKAKLVTNQEKIKHVVNVSERSGAEIEFLKSKQWVINLLDHRKQLIKQGNMVDWYPSFMKERYKHWIENLQWDWVISRQRFYGVPFPVWYHKKTGKVILPKKEELPLDPRIGEIPKGYKKEELVPEMDVMDTWMTSSLTPQINANWFKTEKKDFIPMSLRPQAHDIIRTWAFYTIAKSYFHSKKLPWRDIILSGHGLDSKGKKMSKSKGNFIEAAEIIQKYGADALRFWGASSQLGKDYSYNEDEIRAGTKLVTKLWNAHKFTNMHLEDFENEKIELNLLDKGIISKFNKLIREITFNFDKYDYAKSKLLIEEFFWNEICDNYLEIVKDRLYNPNKRGESERKSAQFTLYYLMLNSLKVFAPIMPFITEELYQIYYKKHEKHKSIHISKWPEFDKNINYLAGEKTYNKFIEILNKVRSEKAKHNKSMKHEIILSITEEDRKILKHVLDDLKAVTQSKEVLFGNFEIGI